MSDGFASMHMRLYTGIGTVSITRDGKIVRRCTDDPVLTVIDAENMASEEPELEWKIVMVTPRWEATFLRVGRWRWKIVHG